MVSKISIVTPVYQDDRIFRTMLSLEKQVTEHEIEHVVIDGGSDGDFVNRIRAAAGDNTVVISEPDEGIYDAMNKGIRIARGEIVAILNADDYYADTRVIESVVSVMEKGQSDIAYGDLVMVNDKGIPTRFWTAGSFKKWRYYLGWMPPHPTVFVRRTVYDEVGQFTLALPIAADYEWLLRASFSHSLKWSYVPHPITCMTAGGASNGTIGKTMRANLVDVRRAWGMNHIEGGFLVPFFKPLSKVHQFFAPRWRARKSGVVTIPWRQ